MSCTAWKRLSLYLASDFSDTKMLFFLIAQLIYLSVEIEFSRKLNTCLIPLCLY